MRRLRIIGLCSITLFALAAASASATVPTWFHCGKAAKIGTAYSGHYTGKFCEEATKVATGGKFELQEGIGLGREFKGKGGATVLHVKTWLGDDRIECTSVKDSGKPALPNLETGVAVTYKGCKALGSKKCSSAGALVGEIKITGMKGELGYVEESPTPVVGLKLESAAHPGPGGEIVRFSCGDLEVTLTGGLIGVRTRDVNVVSKESETVDLAGEYIGEREHQSSKYKPLVNIVGWADEQAAIAKEITEDQSGKIVKMARPVLKALMCGGHVEEVVHEHCLAEAYAGQDQTMLNKGEALMVKANMGAGGPKSLLIGEEVPHENAGDSKTEEITPVKFVAKKSGTVEELCYETGGYLFKPVETSLVLGIEEDVGGVPGKVLGEGTFSGKLGINSVARVTGLKVPITKGKTYFLDFLPLGGAVTYWYEKTETVIYSVNHKKLVEGLPEKYEWIEEAEAQPIGIWANGT